jgi:hypothetical protein
MPSARDRARSLLSVVSCCRSYPMLGNLRRCQKLNLPGVGHRGPPSIAGWQWLPIANAAYHSRLQGAINIINSRILAFGPCNAAFRALPGGRTFAQVWNDPAVWISFDPGGKGGRFGATLGKEVTLSQYTYRMGQWTLVATLIHELAHVNGADGITHAAERTLQKCLMGAHHDPTILGQIQAAPKPIAVAAGLGRGGSTSA